MLGNLCSGLFGSAIAPKPGEMQEMRGLLVTHNYIVNVFEFIHVRES